MKKSSFVAMILGTIGGVLFALGMCMALIAEWNAFTPGVVLDVGMCMVMVWGKLVLGVVIGIVGIVLLLCLIPLVKGIK